MSAPESKNLFFDLYSAELPGDQNDVGRQEAPPLPYKPLEGQIDCGSLEDCSANIISSKESRRHFNNMSKLTVASAQIAVDYHIGGCTIVGL